MKTRVRKEINSYLIDYLKKVFPDHNFPKNRKNYVCPFCNHDDASASIFPADDPKLRCFNPNCKFEGDIFDLVRKMKPQFEEESDDTIGDYLLHFLKIKLTPCPEEIFDEYEKQGFCLVPLQPNSKIPIKGMKDWQNSEYRNKNVWLDWYDRGYNFGLLLGEKSGVIAVDIDDDSAFEMEVKEGIKVKDVLGETLTQTTGRGVHKIYKHDPSFYKTINKLARDKGFEMELRVDGAYCVVAPSSCEGDNRVWSNESIQAMPQELKEFFLQFYKGDTKSPSEQEEIQEAIDNEKIGIVDLAGKRNSTFIKSAGILRKQGFSRKQVEKILNHISYNFIDKPLPQNEMLAMLDQVEKYNLGDKEELKKEILEHFDVVKEVSAFQLASSLKFEQKDVEKILKELEENNQIIYQGNGRYKKLESVEWEEDWTGMSQPLTFEVPWFSKYAHFDQGNMMILGGSTGTGKTICVANILKKLKEQNIKGYLINTEAGSKIGKHAQKLGLQVGDFYFKTVKNATDIELEDNAVTIIDWLSLKDFAKADHVFFELNEQLKKHSGFLIIMMQLKKDGRFFAENLVDFYASFVASYHYQKEGDKIDNCNTYWKTHKIRDSRVNLQYLTIPMRYNPDTKILEERQ